MDREAPESETSAYSRAAKSSDRKAAMHALDKAARSFNAWAAAAAYQQKNAPVRPTKKSGKRALSRAIANRDAR
jgi:hypothetical protein